MCRTLILFFLIFSSCKLFASKADLFSYDEKLISEVFYELEGLETEINNNNFSLEIAQKYKHLNLILVNPDGESKTAGDSFFKGFTLGCIGVIDAYLEDDHNKYKRGPLWTGCCLNTIILAGLYYLLDTNYFKLIPNI
jgi:hypothetical protein